MGKVLRKVKTAAQTMLQFLKVDDPSGGVDLRRSVTLLDANRSRICRNWTLDEPGALKVYPGWASWLTSSLGSARGQGGRRIYLAGVAAFTLFAFNGGVYKPSDAGVAGAAVLTGLDGSNEIDFPYDRDFVAALDGANVPQKSTDGSTWTQLGISAPTVAPVASAVAGGALIAGNTYEVSYTYKDDALGHEGNESDTDTQAAAGANLTVRVAVTASADPQVDSIVIYVRDVTAGEEIRRRYGTFANATASYDVTSNNWETAPEAPTDHDVSPVLKFATPWKNRWWGADADVPNRLWFTQIFETQSWPALFFIDIPFEKGDEITALCPQGDTLVVFGAASKPFLVIGQTSLDFEVRPAFGAQAGAKGFRAVAAIENGILHAADEGVYIFDGATDRLLTDDIDPGWQDAMQRAAVADLQRIAVVYDPPRKFVHVSVPRLFPFGTSGEWILDLHRTRITGDASWTSTDRNVGGYIPYDGPETTLGNRGRLFSWSDSVGLVFEECTGTTANGSDMVADYTGPTFATGGVVARFTWLTGEVLPTNGTFTAEVMVDGRSMGSDTLDIGSDLPLYDSGLLYDDGIAYDGGGADRVTFSIEMPLEAEGLTALAKYRYSGQSSFKLYTYQFEVHPESLPRAM